MLYGKHHMNAYHHNPDTMLVAICDTDTERCDDLAMAYGVMGYTRLDALLQEEAIDVVSVATPDPYHAESILTTDDVISVPTEWLNWASASSPVWFLGSHCFDLVRHLSGLKVVSVYAAGQKRLMVECGLDTFDSVQSLLTMADGSSWVVENSWVLPEGFPKDNVGRIDILCEATYIRSTSQHRGLEIITPGMTLTPNSYFVNYRNGVASVFGIDPINDFVRAVRHKAPYPVTAEDGLAVSRICVAVHRSLESARPEQVHKSV
ncbi:dehydrogenase [Superficieibacter electus]|uniref:Dehydrogenase n=1 Tax=Superficieibacter electus TaxID=2022662 RepID=A0A2P5GGQ4_9ENTR|nr:Gfo/Idh/MocA family oxidoreductase [Superficieibacter electus]POP40433.1 dehydrogenase [Superficieibacter electus]POP40997.1 dehydrogenase [Superficieibacter electus]